MYCSIVFII